MISYCMILDWLHHTLVRFPWHLDNKLWLMYEISLVLIKHEKNVHIHFIDAMQNQITWAKRCNNQRNCYWWETNPPIK